MIQKNDTTDNDTTDKDTTLLMTQKKKYRQINTEDCYTVQWYNRKYFLQQNDKPDKDATDLMTKCELLATAGGSEPLTCSGV